MIEVNIQQDFLGEPKNPTTMGHIFKRFGPRNWERFHRAALEGIGQWRKITDANVLDALEVGFTYGRRYLRWQISGTHE